MASRYTLFVEKKEIEQHFNAEFDESGKYEPSYNIYPFSPRPVVRIDHSGRRIITHYNWGFDGTGSKHNRGEKQVDVFKEKLEDEAYFKGLLRNKRCIIPANGFYEWKTLEDRNEPFYLKLLNKDLIGFAGLYDDFESSDGKRFFSFVMITVSANAMVNPLNSEMPAILNEDSYDFWLNRDIDDMDTLSRKLEPVVIYEMAALRVPEDVNDTSNDSSELIQPIPR